MQKNVEVDSLTLESLGFDLEIGECRRMRTNLAYVNFRLINCTRLFSRGESIFNLKCIKKYFKIIRKVNYSLLQYNLYIKKIVI